MMGASIPPILATDLEAQLLSNTGIAFLRELLRDDFGKFTSIERIGMIDRRQQPERRDRLRPEDGVVLKMENGQRIILTIQVQP